MMRCPDTGTLVWTGFGMTASLFADAALDNYSIRTCSSCGHAHTWSKKDAVLEPPPPMFN